MEIEEVNSRAWDEEGKKGNWWTRTVSREEIDKARSGKAGLRITTKRTVPESWVSPLRGKKVLVLCGGGGQQTPLLAAFGARVTSLDISPGQTEKDRKALELYGLEGECITGSVLSMPFDDGTFDAVVNPVSLNFVGDLDRAYDEIRRVLRKEGTFMTGIANPVLYLFDERKIGKKLKVKYTLPFSSVTSLSGREVERKIRNCDTLEFSHTLEKIIRGPLMRGFILEDYFSDEALSEPLDSYIGDCFMAFLFRAG